MVARMPVMVRTGCVADAGRRKQTDQAFDRLPFFYFIFFFWFRFVVAQRGLWGQQQHKINERGKGEKKERKIKTHEKNCNRKFTNKIINYSGRENKKEATENSKKKKKIPRHSQSKRGSMTGKRRRKKKNQFHVIHALALPPQPPEASSLLISLRESFFDSGWGFHTTGRKIRKKKPFSLFTSGWRTPEWEKHIPNPPAPPPKPTTT